MSKDELEEVEDVKNKRQRKIIKLEQRAVIKKEKRKTTLEKVKVKLENMSMKEAEVMADVDLVIELEDIDRLEDEMASALEVAEQT